MTTYFRIAHQLLANIDWSEYCYHTSSKKQRWERAEPYILASDDNDYIDNYFIKAYGDFAELRSEEAREWWRDTFGVCPECNDGLPYDNKKGYTVRDDFGESLTFCDEFCSDEYWRKNYQQNIQDEIDDILTRYNITDEDTIEEIEQHIRLLDNYFDYPNIEQALIDAGYLKD